jgi:hypothetical protein
MANANMPSVINQPYTCRVKIYRNAHEGGRKGGREGGRRGLEAEAEEEDLTLINNWEIDRERRWLARSGCGCSKNSS